MSKSVGTWSFSELSTRGVRDAGTYRDLFDNEDVNLSSALVREAIQNSMDAGTGDGPVKVDFNIVEISGEELLRLGSYLEGLTPHLSECGIETPSLSEDTCRVLLVEDYGTCGLSGSLYERGCGNFAQFWRAHGESGKAGSKGGRWGYGKNVYPYSSDIRSYFGWTIRSGEEMSLLMGQSVLPTHKIASKEYRGYGLWCSNAYDEETIELPVSDPEAIAKFRELFGVRRKCELGLSVAVPYCTADLDVPTLIDNVVRNHAFSILSGDLIVRVGEVRIDRSSFMDIAEETTKNQGTMKQYSFLSDVGALIENGAPIVSDCALEPNCDIKELFSDQKIELMKSQFVSGETIYIQLPIELMRINGEKAIGEIDLFLRSLLPGDQKFYQIIRGPITLSGERIFRSPAYMALVARDKCISEFLGDAENAAHTKWDSYATKLKENWQRAAGTVAIIRRCASDIYHIVAESDEDNHFLDSLIGFFGIEDRARAPAPEDDTNECSDDPEPKVPPSTRAFEIGRVSGGFSLTAGKRAGEWVYPKLIRVKVAYDTIGGNPFKRHSQYDFDLRTGDSVTVECHGGEAEAIGAGEISCRADSESFRLSVHGFDPKRDLIIGAWES